MKFIHTDLGRCQEGELVEVTVHGNAANVRLLDRYNLSRYRNAERYQFYGGLVEESPFRIEIPEDGHWHVVVDMLGLHGVVRSSARVLRPTQLPLKDLSRAPFPSLSQDPASIDSPTAANE